MSEKSPMLKLTLLLVSCLTIMSILTISPSLPEMQDEFAGIKNIDMLVRFTLTVPALFIALISPIAGIIIDRYGRLRLLWMALIAYAVSGASGYFLENIYHIFISRAFLGIAVGISMTIVTTLVADYFEGQERQKFVGIQIAFMSLGGIIFLGLGGVFADIGWRVPFLIYLLALAFLPLSIVFLREPDISRHSRSVDTSLKSPSIIWLLFVNVMIMWILFFLIPVQTPFHLKEIGVESNALIGIAIAMSTLFSAVSAFSYSKIKDKFNFYVIYIVGYFLMAAGFLISGLAQNYGMVVLAMMVAGLGIGMMIPNTNMWVMKLAPPQIRGREIGRLTTFWFMGQFLSPVILLPVVHRMEISGTFILAAVLLLIMSGIFLVLNLAKFSAKDL